MRAYLAIIKDSFREAIVSRVLWVLLIVSGVVLLLLAPFQVTENAGTTLTPLDLRDIPKMFDTIYAGRLDTSPTPAKRVWDLLPDNLHADFKSTAEAKDDNLFAGTNRMRIVLQSLETVIRSDEFYEPASFADVRFYPETKALIERGGELDENEVARRNRLILQNAFPGQITSAPPKQITVSYFGKDFYGPLSGPGYDKREYVTWYLTSFADYGVGVLGVFCAILVTASIIPQTFEQGAIDLLLSKPVSRPLVFLTKFFGGCIFIALVATFCVGGIWILSGLRWGVWHGPFLLAIPVVTFIFAIYYSISALAGAIWRNAIVSVIITVAFWATCFLVWGFHAVGGAIMQPETLVRVVPTSAGMFAIRESKETLLWQNDHWERTLVVDMGPQNPMLQFPGGSPVGPVYDAASKRVFQINQPNLFSNKGPQLIYADQVADGTWLQQTGIEAPSSVENMFVHGGTLFTVSPYGISRLDGGPAQKQSTGESVLWGLVPLSRPTGEESRGGKFVSASDLGSVAQPFSAAVEPESGRVVIANSNLVYLLALDEDGKNYKVLAQEELDVDRTRLATIGGQTIVLAREDGYVQILNATDLAETAHYQLPAKNTPRFIAASPDGRWFGIVTHQKNLWLYDAQNGQVINSGWQGQGDLTAINFNAENQLLLVDEIDRVTTYDPAQGFQVVAALEPPSSGGRNFMKYGVEPIYTIFPKPGELGDLMRYLVNETAAQAETDDLSQQRETLNVWQPVWSSMVFITIVLGLGALYIWRKDF